MLGSARIQSSPAKLGSPGGSDEVSPGIGPAVQLCLGKPASLNSNYYDMLDWMMQDNFQGQYMAGPGTSTPRYEYMDASQGVYYDMKNAAGFPWDVNYYDNTSDGYLYQWATENVWGDPSTYKAFDTTTTMPWVPRCVPVGAAGKKLATIKLAGAPYHIYDTACTMRQQPYDLGPVINEVWDNGNLTLGGNLPANLHTLALSYRYSCSPDYSSCKYKEVFEYGKAYGLLRWTYYILTNGQYVQNNQTIHNLNNTLASGPIQPVHPCWQ
ncbi:MAG: hypothetical protein H0X25_10750 [Acidobacteriales bacterium]|nr:hypothetical protein [Terriglobales bacterium]